MNAIKLAKDSQFTRRNKAHDGRRDKLYRKISPACSDAHQRKEIQETEIRVFFEQK